MGGTGVIDHFLEVFTRYIDGGFGLLPYDDDRLALSANFAALAEGEDDVTYDRLGLRPCGHGFCAHPVCVFLCSCILPSVPPRVLAVMSLADQRQTTSGHEAYY